MSYQEEQPNPGTQASRWREQWAGAVIREHLAGFGASLESPFYVKVLGWVP